MAFVISSDIQGQSCKSIDFIGSSRHQILWAMKEAIPGNANSVEGPCSCIQQTLAWILSLSLQQLVVQLHRMMAAFIIIKISERWREEAEDIELDFVPLTKIPAPIIRDEEFSFLSSL